MSPVRGSGFQGRYGLPPVRHQAAPVLSPLHRAGGAGLGGLSQVRRGPSRGQGDVAAPVRHPDKTLRKILIAVILVPVFLLALIVASFGAYSKSGSSSFQAVSFAEYESGQESPEIREAVAAWIGGAEPGHGYALRYDHHTDVGDEHFYLIYVPGGEELSDSGFGQMSGLFGTTLELNLRSSGGSGSLFCMTASAEKPPRLKITLNGKKIPCDVTVVDYNPTLYFIEPGWENPPLPG